MFWKSGFGYVFMLLFYLITVSYRHYRRLQISDTGELLLDSTWYSLPVLFSAMGSILVLLLYKRLAVYFPILSRNLMLLGLRQTHPWGLLAWVFWPVGRVLKENVTQTHPVGWETRRLVGFSGGFGAV
jgi:hypothetical protein